ncbi:MAG: tRNA (guanosine(37)-N1)-methyltransferase TrmD [Gemmatimonadota bacterium]|nr:tRNA (guanosine(37)-N1)-methyltransferase TrmD [Gemmatimonadota bacterium]MDQ8166917.1 tRNA (guanosine(37)-N1)-methyltransferase TrmD [Gemmatimonadota bacterium]
MLRINVVTIFPEFFAGPLSISIPAKAAGTGGVEYRLIDLRTFTYDRHRTVDDYPFGGGPGMVMKPGPFFEAVESVQAAAPIVLLSPRGRRFSHADAVRFAAGTELTLLCGHYKDIDERVATHLATEELSLGDFVLSGGEPAALAIIDATVRLLPGAMSDLESARTDSFFDRGISAPSYTRPAEYRGFTVPDVLVGGDHAKVAAWRDEQSLERTRQAEARDRAEWIAREQTIAAREAAIAAVERVRAAKALKKAKEKAAKERARARAARKSAADAAEADITETE